MAPRLTYPYSYNGFTFVSSRKGIDGKKITKIICFCGMEFEGSEGGVKTGNKKSCGCLGKPRKITDYPYEIHGIMVLKTIKKINRRKYKVLCQCSCGGQFEANEGDIRVGDIKRCPLCRNKRGYSNPNYRHGMQGTAIYSSWSTMKDRCNRESNKHYHNYGGRGITYDKSWMCFDKFFEDMGCGWSEGLQIDRIDNNGNYCKDNCRWVTPKENQRNKRSNRIIDGIFQYEILDIGEKYGMNRDTLSHRFSLHKLDIRGMLDFPIRGYERVWPSFTEEISRILAAKSKTIAEIGL